VRLCLAQRDFSRMGILANKVNRKVLEEEGFEAQRLRFYNLMAQLAHHSRDALTLAKHCAAVLATRGVAAAPAQWKPALESQVLFVALAPWSNESSDMLARLRSDVRLEDVGAAYSALAALLSTPELIPWPLPQATADALAAHPAFALDLGAMGGAGASAAPAPAAAAAASSSAPEDAAMGASASASASGATAVSASLASTVLLAEDEPRSRAWWPVLRKRVLQHNLRTIARAYSCARLERLQALTGVNGATLEAQLSELVARGALAAKIDRPAGTVSFRARAPAVQVLDAWASDLGECLERVERVVHLLRKEEQLAEAAGMAGAGGGGGGSSSSAARG
jgi:26S proteasome regulatory subunit N5